MSSAEAQFILHYGNKETIKRVFFVLGSCRVFSVVSITVAKVNGKALDKTWNKSFSLDA